jgi:hypothetical protein
MIAQHGSVENALQQTAMRLFAAEDASATAERTITDLRGKLPGDGALVLPKAEAAEYAKVIALKLTPDQIVERVKKAGELEGTVAQTALEKLAREAATAAGLDPEAFAAHAAAKGLHIELKDTPVIEKGKTVTKKLPHVRPAADDKALLVALSEYTSKLPAYDQRALTATGAPGAPAAPAGTPWPGGQQPSTPAASTGDRVGDYMAKLAERGKARPNPLIPRQAPQPAAAATP